MWSLRKTKYELQNAVMQKNYKSSPECSSVYSAKSTRSMSILNQKGGADSGHSLKKIAGTWTEGLF